MNKIKIFIGNIGSNITGPDLRRLFSEFGLVEDADVPIDKYGDSRGFGYVVMSSEEKAKLAIRALNKKKFMEQFLFVCNALPEIKQTVQI